MKKLSITSAMKLSDEIKRKIEDTFIKKYNEEVVFTYEINRDLIGGILVTDGEFVYNGTIANRLNKVDRIIRK